MNQIRISEIFNSSFFFLHQHKYNLDSLEGESWLIEQIDEKLRES